MYLFAFFALDARSGDRVYILNISRVLCSGELKHALLGLRLSAPTYNCTELTAFHIAQIAYNSPFLIFEWLFRSIGIAHTYICYADYYFQ